ncbi:hypothetical protein HPP92_023143 [Vanilla planifolia]|uniref:YDG domain-containing protein n=1 Tax=Vanilla planifolia TaxID=51239 RepID=A0A835PVC5_VANPL|nr:hypothetical protein HPP92_023451 [Vanilla planifolia]KAG0460015.1 hypothetical protein HPP92_023143 [Vanilla planifolia]
MGSHRYLARFWGGSQGRVHLPCGARPGSAPPVLNTESTMTRCLVLPPASWPQAVTPGFVELLEGVLSYIGMGGCQGGGMVRRGSEDGGRNLALKRSMEEKMPVRVIYGFRNLKQRTASVFVYDGALHSGCTCRKVIGSNDCFVFEFQLRRMEGQQPSSSKQEFEMM